MSSPRSLSPWWALLLVPAALAGGRLIGGLPVAARTTPPPQTHDGGPIVWRSSGEAIDESRRTGKPVLYDFNAEWCGPCQAMKAELFESPSHSGAISDAVVPVTVVDRRHEEGSNPAEVDELKWQYGVHAFPTLVVVMPGTGRIQKHVGFGDAAQTEAWITQAAKSVRQ